MTPPAFAQEVAERARRLRESAAFGAYERVREHVFRMKDLEAGRRGGTNEPSAYWSEELANFDYMLDASPMVISKLRHHSYHLTGLRVYEYRSNHDAQQRRFGAKLRALVDRGGGDLLVPEARELGGFGFEIDGDLYNLDTLKFYEALIAMRDGGVLGPLLRDDEPRVVLEIGAGWGGFAYQVKRLCPRTTYVIVDFPELFLFSATYLMTLFPEARFVFCDDARTERELADGVDADFVFIPHTSLEHVDLPRLDLTINMVSFQEMTAAQVEAYARYAYAQNCPYLYSLNRARSAYNRELDSVSESIARWYWPHEIPVLPVSYNELPDRGARALAPQTWLPRRRGMPYRHLVGWRRIEA